MAPNCFVNLCLKDNSCTDVTGLLARNVEILSKKMQHYIIRDEMIEKEPKNSTTELSQYFCLSGLSCNIYKMQTYYDTRPHSPQLTVRSHQNLPLSVSYKLSLKSSLT